MKDKPMSDAILSEAKRLVFIARNRKIAEATAEIAASILQHKEEAERERGISKPTKL